ncbi:Flavin-dependent thymidylate synthase [bacterium HR24]|nr:Flavin-dependent thymidylate synthase [bacterium HR24]
MRHRAGWGYSQLSQRYVDESDAAFVVPDVIASNERAYTVFLRAIEAAQAAYLELVEILQDRFRDVPDRTLRRKLARQAARSVLGGATETIIFVTANARALRHFIELRGDVHADTEIRKVALEILRIMQREAPSIFGDYRIERLPDGTEVARTDHRKV